MQVTLLITCDFTGQNFIVDKVKVIEFKYVVVVLATEKPAEESAGFCFSEASLLEIA